MKLYPVIKLRDDERIELQGIFTDTACRTKDDIFQVHDADVELPQHTINGPSYCPKLNAVLVDPEKGWVEWDGKVIES